MKTNILRAGQGKSIWVVGDLYTILASCEDTGGAYALIRAEVPPQSGPPAHVHHREDEAFYILEGKVLFEADGRTMEAAAGSWVTLPRGTRHSFKNVGETTARLLIVVHPSGLEKFFQEVGTPATDELAGPPPPDIDKLLAVAPRYGLEIQPPSA